MLSNEVPASLLSQHSAQGCRSARRMRDFLLSLLLSGLPQMYIFLFYCVIPTIKMTPNNVQTAVKHQHLAPRKTKMHQEETVAGERNYWETLTE